MIETSLSVKSQLIEYIEKVFIPYRDNVISKSNLSPDQKMVVILDLHYSHKYEKQADNKFKVLSKFTDSNRIPSKAGLSNKIKSQSY
jgi:hypothetical protein